MSSWRWQSWEILHKTSVLKFSWDLNTLKNDWEHLNTLKNYEDPEEFLFMQVISSGVLESACTSSQEFNIQEFFKPTVKPLEAWNWQQRQYLHCGNWQMLHIRALFPFLEIGFSSKPLLLLTTLDIKMENFWKYFFQLKITINPLLSHKNEWNHAICSNMDEPRDYQTKWSPTEKDKYMISLTCEI